jgi:Domain of unknown function (DUF1877)
VTVQSLKSKAPLNPEPLFPPHGAPVVGRGYHIALAREHAKTLFGIKEDTALRKFLNELVVQPEMQRSGRVLDCGILWEAIHRCLTEGELDPAGGDFPLNHAVLGGKQLHRAADYTAVLIRPDMPRFIADALAELEEDDLRKKFFGLSKYSYNEPIDEKHFMEVWRRLQDLKVFFAAAAENMEAVVFTAKFQE